MPVLIVYSSADRQMVIHEEQLPFPALRLWITRGIITMAPA